MNYPKIGQRWLWNCLDSFIVEIISVQEEKHNYTLCSVVFIQVFSGNSYFKNNHESLRFYKDSSYWFLLSNQDKINNES